MGLIHLLMCVGLMRVVIGAALSDPKAVEHTRNEILQRIRRQTEDECAQADIVFVVDSSGSIGIDNWNTMLNFINSVVDSFPVGDLGARFGFIRYGYSVNVEFYLDDYSTKEEYRDKISSINWMDQSTNTAGGIQVMLEDVFVESRGNRPQVPDVGIVITDGESNVNPENTQVFAEKARDAKITLFALGIGNATNEEELKNIANPPKVDSETGETISYVYQVSDFMALEMIRLQLVQAACEIASQCRQDADITFILDGSSSVDQDNFNMVKGFVGDLLEDLNVAKNKSHISVITFSDSATLNFDLQGGSDSRKTVREGLQSIVYPRGTTHTYSALQLALDQVYGQDGDRPAIKDIIVVFTDGGSDNFQQTIDVARTARLRGIYIFVVGLTKMANMYEINEMATDPDDSNVFMVSNFTSLPDIRGALKKALCNDVDECLSDPCLNGGSCYDGMNMFVCQCPAGWAGFICDIPCSEPKDIALVMDASTSMGRQTFYQMQDFIKQLVLSLPIDKELHSKFALETYSTDVRVEFGLDEYRTKQEIINAISLAYTSSGSTNTGLALEKLVSDVFSTGNRPAADDVALIMSDGHSADRMATYEAALAAKDMGISLLTLTEGKPSYYNMRELHGIASDPDTATMFYGMSYTEMTSVNNTMAITQAVCNEEDNCNPHPCNTGTCVDKIGDYECVCPDGFSGRHCEKGCDRKLDVVFLVDESGSIRRHRFNEIFKPMLKEIISSFSVSLEGTRVGLAKFGNDVNVEFHLNTYSRMEDVIQGVELMTYSAGKTNVAAALKLMREQMFSESNGDREDAPNICLIITDGLPTLQVDDTLPESIEARVHGIHMIAVAAEMKADNLYLKGIASDPAQANIIAVDRFSDLLPRVSDIAATTCNDVDECDPSPCVNALSCYDGLSQAICDCNTDYTGRNCSRRCTSQQDVVFVLDASGSMEKNYDLQMQLTKEIIHNLNWAFSRTRVGVVTYSNSASTRFYLNTYTDKESVLNAVAYLAEMGKTNTAGALSLVGSDMLTSVRGDRAGVNNVVIIMTDGRSNINTDDTVPQATQLKDLGVRLMSVGVGSTYDIRELDAIATSPADSNRFLLEDETDLTSVADRIVEQLCQ